MIRHLLFSSREEDLKKKSLCIEEKRVHPHVEIKKITPELQYRGPKPHPLAGFKVFVGHEQHGLFARKKIEKGEELGEYVGEIALLNSMSLEEVKGTGYNWVLSWKSRVLISIDSRKIANEMTFVNDYRGLKAGPNVVGDWMIDEGMAYFGYIASQTIEKDEEIVADYGAEWAARLSSAAVCST